MYNQNILDNFQNIETPFYYYDLDVLSAVLNQARTASEQYGYHIHYAIKANANERILDVIQSFGFGADCVSGNEVLKSVEHNFAPEKIAFAGVGKSDREIIDAINSNIGAFHVESFPELEVINEIAQRLDRQVNVALRINPNVDAKTHAYITTGLNENKFGINPWELESVLERMSGLNNINFIGLHFHIGSQITDMSVFAELATKVNHLVEFVEERGHTVNYINLGGGLGVDYDNTENLIPDFYSLFSAINENLVQRDDQEVHFELGRSLVATCGDLISRVLYVKEGLNKKFAILDAGMTELMRPALYKSVHKLENLTSELAEDSYDVVGPICESSDTFAKDYSLPQSKRGDLIAIKTSGAYGEVMSSNYNLRNDVRRVFSDEIGLNQLKKIV